MFSKETEYALRGLVYIQSQNYAGRRPGISEIAREIDAPHFFTAKIMNQMVKHGFVASIKGKGGGFFFETGKPDINLGRLIEVTGGNRSLTGCGFGLKNCNDANPCPLHEKYAPIRDSILTLVATETIQSLACRNLPNPLSAG